MHSRKDSCLGVPISGFCVGTRHVRLTCTLTCSDVFLYKKPMTSCGSAPRFSSITRRVSVVDSSRQSMTIGSFFSANSSPIFSMIDARTTAYGIEVMTMRLPSRRSVGSST